MKTILSMLLAFTTLISASSALSLPNSSDVLFGQLQADYYCAESEADKKKKKAEGETEEEPDCD